MARQLLTAALSLIAVYCVVLGSLALLADAKFQSSIEAFTGADHIRLGPLKDMHAWLNNAGLYDLFQGSLSGMSKEERWRLIREENEWKNSLVSWMLPDAVRAALPHCVLSWLRFWTLIMALYLGGGGLWCWYAYVCFGHKLYKSGQIPAAADLLGQIRVSVQSIPVYAMLPTITEWAAENGWTNAYPRIENVGLGWHIIYFVLYMLSVEFGGYWIHRKLHEFRWAYRLLHWDHHKYNKEYTLSPFAGFALHPIDGVFEGSPFIWTLLYCPMHFTTVEVMLLFTGIWTTNLHDNIHGKVMPILGAGYHTMHHTIHRVNYGLYTIYMDWMFGTLYSPEECQENGGKMKRH